MQIPETMQEDNKYELCFDHCKQFEELFDQCMKACTKIMKTEDLAIIAIFLSIDYKKFIYARKLLEEATAVG